MGDKVLILPGYGNSGPGHWQSLWQAAGPAFQRVEQRDWEHPVCAEWVAALEKAVAEAGDDCVLVAHSLACLLVAHWAAQTRQSVRAALLVALPDPSGPAFPSDASGFAPVPLMPLPFPSLVVASRDDPYGSLDFSRSCAGAWGSRWVDIGPAGHINGDSGLGDWPEGKRLLESLTEAAHA
ncbi:RBBP9/YdeN family alpha/beta hydrolase [Pseudomonas indica]|jgi:predicted alpha/beta hydrolase family esterase|uniref:RBBP9/YdeN family alpha/beta hydrolase n=1 Tax=Pseudomonas indica TaxID=137658 RepID=UPI003FD29E19